MLSVRQLDAALFPFLSALVPLSGDGALFNLVIILNTSPEASITVINANNNVYLPRTTTLITCIFDRARAQVNIRNKRWIFKSISLHHALTINLHEQENWVP
jgi:hypothetical protein